MIVFATWNDRRFLYLVAFLIPLQKLSLDIGILLSWYKILFPVTIVAMILGRRSFRINMRIMRHLIAFIVYAIALTALLIGLSWGFVVGSGLMLHYWEMTIGKEEVRKRLRLWCAWRVRGGEKW